MIKLFQGDCQNVQKDLDTWIEVYKPEIKQLQQSMISVEHTLVILITVLYEPGQKGPKVEYKVQG